MGNVALVAALTYELVPPILRESGLEVVSVPCDDEGIDLKAVEAEVQSRGGAGGGASSVRLLYLVPTHSNPTGSTLSIERRKKLADMSRDMRFYVVSDEVYGLLGFKSKTEPSIDPVSHVPLSALANCASVISVGSFSKILAPGLRVGWIHCPDATLRERLADTAVTYSGGSPVPALAAASMAGAALSGALTRHLNVARRHLSMRQTALAAALSSRLIGTVSRLWPCSGGYFLWLSLPSAEVATAVAERAMQSRPPVCVGHIEHAAGLRLCFAALSTEALGVAANVLGDAIRDVCGMSSDG